MRPTSITPDPGLEPFRGQEPFWDDAASTAYTPSFSKGGLSARTRHAKKSATDWIQVICLVLAVCLSISIVGVLARALVFYNSSYKSRVVMPSGLIMMAWPSDRQHFLLPTYLLLSAAAAGAGLGLIVLIWKVLSLKRSAKANVGRVTTIASAIVVIGLFAAALAIFKIRDGNSGLLGWSCQYWHVEHAHDRNTVGLEQVCISMSAAWYMGIAVGALELLALLTVLLPSSQTKSQPKQPRGFILGRSGYSGLKETGRGESDE